MGEIITTSDFQRLAGLAFSGKAAGTVKGYKRDLTDFAVFLGVDPSPEAVLRRLHADGPMKTNLNVMDYKTQLSEKKLAASTINRKLSAINSLMSLARMTGVLAWDIEVPLERDNTRRDMRGPGKDGFEKLIEENSKELDPTARMRNHAILWLLFGAALRRNEVSLLDVADVDLEHRRLMVMGKGRRAKEPFTISASVVEPLRLWLAHPGRAAVDPVFHSLSSNETRGHRLTGTAIYQIVRGLGAAAGLGLVRPHGLRHAAVTQALDASNGDLRRVRHFSRHASINMVQRYDDARRDMGGEIADLLGESMKPKAEE